MKNFQAKNTMASTDAEIDKIIILNSQVHDHYNLQTVTMFITQLLTKG